MKKPRVVKKILKWSLGIFLSLLILFLICWFLIQQPSVQGFLVNKITKQLSANLNTQVSVRKVNIRFFSRAVFEDIYIADRQQDTLFYAGKLIGDIDLFSLLKKKIYIDQVVLEKAVINLSETRDGATNYSFLLESLQTKDNDKNQATSPWDLRLNNFHLENVRLSSSVDGKSNLSARIGVGIVALNSLDTDHSKVDLKSVSLSQSTILVELDPPDATNPVDESVSDASLIAFPSLPWSLRLSELKGTENSFAYRIKGNTLHPGKVNFQDLKLSNIDVLLEDTQWDEHQLKTSLKQLSFEDQSGFRINHFEVDLMADSSGFTFQDLNLKTPESIIKNNIKLSARPSDVPGTLSESLVFEVNFKPSRLAIADIRMIAPEVMDLYDLRIRDDLQINGRISGTAAGIRAQQIELNIGNKLHLLTDFEATDITNSDKSSWKVNIRDLSSSYLALKSMAPKLDLPEELAALGAFKLKMKANRNPDNWTFEELNFQSSSETVLMASGKVSYPDHPENMQMDIFINSFRTIPRTWEGIFKDGFPVQLDSLDKIEYAGHLKGRLSEFKADGELISDLGKIAHDIELSFNQDYSSAKYSGKIAFSEIDLGSLLNIPDLGVTNLNATVNGEGWQIDSMESDLLANIADITYKKYTYRNIAIDGHVKRKQLTGRIGIKDENIGLSFDGLVNLQNALPELAGHLVLDTMVAQALSLSEKPLFLSGFSDLRLKGNHPDNMDGELYIRNFNFADDSLQYLLDSLHLIVEQSDSSAKRLEVNADFIRAVIDGKFVLTTIPDLVQNYRFHYFPKDTLIEPPAIHELSHSPIDEQDFTIEIDLMNPTLFSILGMERYAFFEDARLRGAIRNSSKFIDLDVAISCLEINGMTGKSLQIKTKGEPGNLVTNIDIDDFISGEVNLSHSNLSTVLDRDSLVYSLNISGDTAQQLLTINGLITQSGKSYEMHLKDALILNEDEWLVNRDNGINWQGEEILFNNLQFTRNGRYLVINSLTSETMENGVHPLNFAFNRFPIGEVMTLINSSGLDLEGEVNGQLTLKDYMKDPYFNTLLDIRDIGFNSYLVGNADITAQELPGSGTVDLAIKVSGPNNEVMARGKINLSDRLIDLTADITKVELEALDPFLEGMVSKSTGSIGGQIELTGKLSSPIINGEIALNEVRTEVDFTRTRYIVDKETIVLKNDLIDFEDMVIRDDQGRVANLSGKINHKSFSNYNLDLSLQTDDFMFLNTTAADNELFYGTLFLDADLTIQGKAEQPKVLVNARTLPNSTFFMSPFTETDVISSDDFVIFASTSEDVTPATLAYTIDNPIPFDVTLNLELLDNAEVQFIVDPLTGDKLVCRGNSNLVLNMLPSGAMELYGNYYVTSGSYFFTYGQLVKRTFEIQEGGSVQFNGNPLEARFDITAVYTARTSTYELVKNETNLSPSEISQAKRKTPVNVLLDLSGSLDAPQISFDILIPEISGELNLTEMDRKLQQLRSNPQELNNQVFGLLLVNSFIQSESASSVFSLSDAGESAALSSVSDLFTNQLNQLADKYIKGVEINFNLETYRTGQNSDDLSTVTALGVGVTKNLLNDRLTFTASGSIDLNRADQTSSLTSIAGDFILEYKLDDGGNYILQVFRKSNFDALNEENTAKNGIGIFIKKSFDDRNKQQ